MLKKRFMVIIFLLVACFLFRYYFFQKTSGELQPIKETVEAAIKIQYGFADCDGLHKIATADFINQLEETFYKSFQPYAINKDFMKTCRKGDGDEYIVSVNVSDFGGTCIHIYTLSKTADGYQITNLQYDI